MSKNFLLIILVLLKNVSKLHQSAARLTDCFKRQATVLVDITKRHYILIYLEAPLKPRDRNIDCIFLLTNEFSITCIKKVCEPSGVCHANIILKDSCGAQRILLRGLRAPSSAASIGASPTSAQVLRTLLVSADLTADENSATGGHRRFVLRQGGDRPGPATGEIT